MPARPGPLSVSEAYRDPGRTALVTNTASGANLRHGVEGVHNRAAAAGLRHYRIDEIGALDDVLGQCARDDVRLIIVNAGDGTVCRLLDIIRAGGCFAQEPVLALLRGGTTNMIHGDVGWKGRPEPALKTLLSCLQSGRGVVRERHVLRVYQSEQDVTRHGFFFGTHALVRAIVGARQRFHERAVTGTMAELLATAAIVWRLLRRRVERDPVLSPVSVEIARNGDEWRRVTHIFLMVVSLRRMILGARPLGPGQRAGLAALSWPDYRLVPWLWRIVRGPLEALETIAMRGELDWTLDGEIYQHSDADGILSVQVGDPARFLVKGGGA